ncbi:MAG: lysylphosphatidylglycerol synthase transmembrane domain-containing protein [Dehalococcoidia bacterium]
MKVWIQAVRRPGFWFRLAFISLLFGLLAWRVNLAEALRTFTAVNYAWVAAALLIFTFSKFIHTLRWRIFLGRIPGLPLSGLFGTFLISNMINNLMPVRAGDLVRIQMPAQRYNIRRAELTATVIVVETLLDAATFIPLLVIGLSLQDVPTLRTGVLWGFAALVGAGLLLAILAARMRLPADLRQTRWARWLPRWLRDQAAELLPGFVDGLAALRDARLAAQAILISFPAWIIEAVVFWLFGEAFGLDLPFSAYLVIMIGANLVVSLPLTPTSIGIYEVAVQEVVALFGVDRALAAGYAIGTHVFISIWIGATGLLAIWRLNLRFEDVFYLRRNTRQAPAAVGDASDASA